MQHPRQKTLYGEVFVKGWPQGSYLFLSLFDLKAPFLRPDPTARVAGARRSGQGWRVSATAGLVLDGFEHDGTLGVVGMTIGGEPACGARKDRATSLYSVGAKTRTMMQ